METHHLANLSGLDEARMARRRLVEAQSATSIERTRDLLGQAVEYLELARLERRDTAAGFVQARELVTYAEAGLRRERPLPLTGSPLELVNTSLEPERRRTLQELRSEAAVNSFQQLRYDVNLEGSFRELRRKLKAGEVEHKPADDGELDVDTALELASLEMDIERSLQRPDDGSEEFDFVDDADIAEPDDRVGPPSDAVVAAVDDEEPDDTSIEEESIATPDGEEPVAGADDEPIATPGESDGQREGAGGDGDAVPADESDPVAGAEEG